MLVSTFLHYCIALIISDGLGLLFCWRGQRAPLVPMVSSFVIRGSTAASTRNRRLKLEFSSSPSSEFIDPERSRFGRQDYWNEFYQKEANFSWYAGWDDLEPFLNEFLGSKNDHILVPGVGNDATLVGMYDAGYSYLTAMDYAPEGIERCREMLGPKRLLFQHEHQLSTGKGNNDDGIRGSGVDLVVADARNLQDVFDTHSFDAILEKGTLDAIFLSGGQDKEKCHLYMQLAVDELSRTVKPGGTWISVAAVAVDQIQACFLGEPYHKQWEPVVLKDDFYTTDDGYTSNNVDGTFLVFRKTLDNF